MTMTSVSTDAAVNAVASAAIEAGSASLADEDYSESNVDTTTTTTTMTTTTMTMTTTAKVKTPVVVEKTHAAASGASLPLNSSSGDMTVVAVDDDTARLRLSENKKGIPAQPSSTSSLPSSSSSPILSRSCKRDAHNSQSKTTLEQQHLHQGASTAISLSPYSTSPCSPSTSSSSPTFIEGSLDEVLLTALQNRQDRLFLLKLEQEYCNFIKDSR